MHKHLTLYLLGLFLTMGICASAQVFVGGVLTQNTTFSKENNPYIVFQELVVPKGINLTIEPGTELRFSSDTRLVVKGDLIARGTISDSIYYIMNLQIPNQSLWNGIVFDSASTLMDNEGNYLSGSILSFNSIYNTNYSLTISGNSGVLIENTLIRKSSYGLYMNDSEHSVIRNCRIQQTGFGVFIPSGIGARYNTFKNNVIINNFNIGLLINNSGGRIQHNIFSGNRISNNYIGLYIGNDGEQDPGMNVFMNNIITANSLEGARIYQDSTIFINNHIVSNGIGINLKHSSFSSISGNIFTDNESWAIQLIDSATQNLIDKNVLNRNGGGVRIGMHSGGNSTDNRFINNTIYQNSGKSFHIESAPQLEIGYNNLLLNGDTNSFVNKTAILIHAENNWWGTAIESRIDSLIYDYLDDAGLGLVQYKLPLNGIDTISPIPAPRNVVKRQAGPDVIVSWDPVNVSDLGGYFVYSGQFDGYFYSDQRNAGQTNSLLLPSFSVFDSIAVTAYDFQADGFTDQLEGHESEYVLALLSPYAGPDTTICLDASILLDKATAFNYEFISWTTAGDGVFSGSHILKSRYTPGTQDLINGEVLLTLSASGLGYSLTDQILISFAEPPFAFAGNDTLIFSDTIYLTSSALSSNDQGVLWQTTGDGEFDDASLLFASYTPGTADLAEGSVQLILQSYSNCGDMMDTIQIEIIKSFSINGRVFAGDDLAEDATLHVMRKNALVIEDSRSVITTQDGTFSINHIVGGEYYLYAIPDKSSYPWYAPTYFYDDLHWKSAHKLVVEENTYDVDISLTRMKMLLPSGEGEISGSCVTSGISGDLCTNIAVFLYDHTGTYLLGWTWIEDNGEFSFPAIPYGSYLIVGEKAGYERFFSNEITLSPAHPIINNAELLIEPFKISIYIPPFSIPGYLPIRLYPNPVTSLFYLDRLPAEATYDLVLTNSEGKSINFSKENLSGETISIHMNSYAAGIYLLRVYSEGRLLQMFKFIKS
ncbi:MAG: right-handed parallel beta-helix repeat-containing protein [Bacteroidales bacterium]|nr:right-handed parallel beta-helix repeat-containing protein [Bacteroidales bacterium]